MNRTNHRFQVLQQAARYWLIGDITKRADPICMQLQLKILPGAMMMPQGFQNETWKRTCRLSFSAPYLTIQITERSGRRDNNTGTVPLKTGRIHHELNSPNLGGHLPHHPTPCYNQPLRRTEMGCGWQGYLDPLSHLSPKRSQNLTFLQTKPTASDRPSSMLRGYV
ncbi:hypothetical protein AVEN_11085-1 [Araneus ventricosus]|uniref:Uncharacterized protein n=1 Tax=Araneus ventricosus TaxID=182803 RepID=A0A4Y2VWB9_ARAVE|nr:hypothetical protein AVEN_11085-1 [Araneus ventricosus]